MTLKIVAFFFAIFIPIIFFMFSLPCLVIGMESVRLAREANTRFGLICLMSEVCEIQ